MKFLAECKTFLAALKAAAKFTEPHSTLPGFRCVKVTAGGPGPGGTVEANVCTDGARFGFPAGTADGDAFAACFEPGPVVKLLSGVSGVVSLEIPADGRVRIACGTLAAEMDTMPAEDFAAWLEPEDGAVEVTASASGLVRALDAAIVASDDDRNPRRCGVRVEVPTHADRVDFIATDGRRLHVASVGMGGAGKAATEEGAAGFTLRLSTARRLAFFLRAHGELSASLRFAPGRIVVHSAHDELRADEHKIVFPGWKKTVLQLCDAPEWFPIPADDLADALGRFSALGFDYVSVALSAEGFALEGKNERKSDGQEIKLRRFVAAPGADSLRAGFVCAPALFADAIRACGPSGAMLRRAGDPILVKSAPGSTVSTLALLMPAMV